MSTSPTTPAPPLPPTHTPSAGFWSETWRRYLHRREAVAALGFVMALAIVAVFSPCIVGTKPIVCYYKGHFYFPATSYFYDRWENPVFQKDGFRQRYPESLPKKDSESWAIWPLNFNDPYRRIRATEWTDRAENTVKSPPTKLNFLGTDGKGVDVFAKLVHGTRIALLVGFVSMGIASAIGILIGAIGGYFGGRIDIVLSRLTEVVMCIPTLVLVLALYALIRKPTIWHTMAIIGATSWTSIARLMRAEFMKIKQTDYVAAARVSGISPLKIILRYILPNALAPVLVPITFGIASAILLESSLSFLGFGAPPPNPSWGSVINSAQGNHQLWWLIVFPGLAVFITVLSYNVIGEALQEATDPRLREGGR